MSSFRRSVCGGQCVWRKLKSLGFSNQKKLCVFVFIRHLSLLDSSVNVGCFGLIICFILIFYFLIMSLERYLVNICLSIVDLQKVVREKWITLLNTHTLKITERWCEGDTGMNLPKPSVNIHIQLLSEEHHPSSQEKQIPNGKWAACEREIISQMMEEPVKQ